MWPSAIDELQAALAGLAGRRPGTGPGGRPLRQFQRRHSATWCATPTTSTTWGSLDLILATGDHRRLRFRRGRSAAKGTGVATSHSSRQLVRGRATARGSVRRGAAGSDLHRLSAITTIGSIPTTCCSRPQPLRGLPRRTETIFEAYDLVERRGAAPFRAVCRPGSPRVRAPRAGGRSRQRAGLLRLLSPPHQPRALLCPGARGSPGRHARHRPGRRHSGRRTLPFLHPVPRPARSPAASQAAVVRPPERARASTAITWPCSAQRASRSPRRRDGGGGHPRHLPSTSAASRAGPVVPRDPAGQRRPAATGRVRAAAGDLAAAEAGAPLPPSPVPATQP